MEPQGFFELRNRLLHVFLPQENFAQVIVRLGQLRRHPDRLQTAHPRPPQLVQETAISALGSVNGK